MGLFSGILRVVGGPIANAIGGASASKKAISGARDATLAGIANGKNDLSAQLAATQGRLDPFEALGTAAAGQQGDILGLHGAGAQGSIIDQLKASPMFQAMFRTGHDTLLNDASATGGLRGGNILEHLANFGSDTLAQVIQRQLENLTPLAQQGQQATEFGGQLGANNATQMAALDTGAGSANAGAILGKTAVSNNMFAQIQKLIQSAASAGAGGGGGFGSLFGGSAPDLGLALPKSGSGLPF
jgi:hypothetical protein